MIRLTAPAKINLFLEITGKRKDGYHLLSTVFQTISLSDELRFKIAPALSLTCSESGLPTDERNLVMRAALRLQALLKESRGAQIHLIKRVPMGAGLGGGSSDAATTLLGLLKLWRQRMAPNVLHKLAVSLGADVPFFLKGGSCYAAGIGDRLRTLPNRLRGWLVVVYPGFGVSTQEAYAKVRVPEKPCSVRSLEGVLRKPTPERLAPLLFNRFEEFVFPAFPKLAHVKERMLAAGAVGTLMSGSGSSVFGLARSAAHAKGIATALKHHYPQCWVARTQ